MADCVGIGSGHDRNEYRRIYRERKINPVLVLSGLERDYTDSICTRFRLINNAYLLDRLLIIVVNKGGR